MTRPTTRADENYKAELLWYNRVDTSRDALVRLEGQQRSSAAMDKPTNAGSLHLHQSVQACIPNKDICRSTLDLARENLSAPIFNHSLRVFLLARWLALKEGAIDAANQDKLALLFAACVCHDLGTCDAFNGPQRFEVEGADAAKTHLLASGIPEQESQQVWSAIALHTSPGIAERIDPFTRLVRLGVLADFSPATREKLGAERYATEIEMHLPRLEIERVLGDAVVCQAPEQTVLPDRLTWPSTEKHPKASWPGMLLRAKLENPGHQGVNPAF